MLKFVLFQYFKENPHFSDRVLKKEYKYLAPPAAADEKPDADGITESMLEFSWQRDIQASVGLGVSNMILDLSDTVITSQATKIGWKEPEKALTKLYPREAGEDDDDLSDPGSFFNFFEHESDPSEVGGGVGGGGVRKCWTRSHRVFLDWTDNRQRDLPRGH